MNIRAGVRAIIAVALLSAALIATPGTSDAQSGVQLPAGFAETAVATDIQNPVGMEVAPDGRIFVLAGNIRRIEIYDDTGYLGEFLDLPFASRKGSGLLGLEFAPDFSATGDVYIAYITNIDFITGPQRFRLSKFSSNGTTADPASEVVLFEVEDIDPAQQQHQGGDLSIGGDGKLYWVLGDRVEGSAVSQPLDSLFGKVLRLNTDGSIPSDNPFYSSLQDEFRAIYANGLRNPYRMERQDSTGDLFMSEVGPLDWEELNKVELAANYGWPLVSGPAGDPLYTDPVHAYLHYVDNDPGGVQVGCAITGGAFYEPVVATFPAEYAGQFFFGDHCFGWIDILDVNTGVNSRFMTGADRLVEVKVNPQTGSLYYLDREYAGDQIGRKGGIGRIDYVGANNPIEITRHPEDITVAIGEAATFDVLVTGQGPFSYQWYRDGIELTGETESMLTVTNAQAVDDGAQFTVTVADANGLPANSDPAALTVTGNSAPVPIITAPATDLRYIAGQEYAFAGSATDVEDGDLDASALSWEIVFHHDDHTHPFIPELDGVAGGTFTPPVNDETAPNVWYRIYLTATDSDGTQTTVVQDVFPLTVEITLQTDPSGERVMLDGTPTDTPVTFTAVAGVNRVLKGPFSHDIGGEIHYWTAWSNDGEREQTISTPTTDTVYTAIYELPDPDLAILTQPADTLVIEGQDATFSVAAVGADPLTYEWYRDEVAIVGATGSTLTVPAAAITDSGASFHVVVTDGTAASIQSDSATLTVDANTPPTAEVTAPTSDVRYEGGQTYAFAGIGTDVEDGDLPATAYSWEITTLHNDHSHDFAVFDGVTSGTFTIPTQGETPADIIYQIALTVTDSSGAETTVIHDLLPANVTVALDSVPQGLTLLLDGQPVTTPHSFLAVPGIERQIEAPADQELLGTTYLFADWSDAGLRAHTIITPAVDETFTATYEEFIDGQLAISQQPSNVSVDVGGDATFSVIVTDGQPPYSYQWYRDGVALGDETNPTLELLGVQAGDDGASFYVIVSDLNDDQVQSDPASLSVDSNTAPVPVITAPDGAELYVAGQSYSFAGEATDAEDGVLSEAALSWTVAEWHDDLEHEVLVTTSGVAGGTFTPPTDGSTATDVFYRITLTAVDSDGKETAVTTDLQPLLVDVTLATEPTGLPLIVDGATYFSPHTFTGVAGVDRSIEAPPTADVAGVAFSFVSWSDDGDRARSFTTPTTNSTLTATYAEDGLLRIIQQPVAASAEVGDDVMFSVIADGQDPVTYQWFRDGTELVGATAATLTVSSVSASDDGASFHVVVSDATLSTVQSDDANLAVNPNAAPVPIISDPDETLLWIAGQPYTFAGSASDAEDGVLGDAALQWRIALWHTDHEHDVLLETSGVSTGTFTPYDDAVDGADHWYRITLTATDANGQTASVTRDVYPLLTELTIDTTPAGGTVTVDGEAQSAPYTLIGTAGFERTIEVDATTDIAGVTYTFVDWSDAGDRSHTIVTPTVATTYTANFEAVPVLEITQQPVATSAEVGQDVMFSVTADGQDPLTYQWYRNGIELSGETGSALLLTGVALADDQAAFHVVVTDATANLVQSNDAILTVTEPPVDEIPTVSIDAPANGSITPAPLTISGTANDDLGIAKVQVVIKMDGTTKYWNGSAFETGWKPHNAALTQPGSVATDWSYTFTPSEDTDIKIIVRSFDTAGQKSVKAIVFSTVELDGGPVVTTVTLDSPSHKDTEQDPVTFAGTFTTPNLKKLVVVIKQLGARNYWNGSAWQAQRIEIPVTVSGSSWSYSLDQPAGDVRDVIVFARVLDNSGDKDTTPKVTIYVQE